MIKTKDYVALVYNSRIYFLATFEWVSGIFLLIRPPTQCYSINMDIEQRIEDNELLLLEVLDVQIRCKKRVTGKVLDSFIKLSRSRFYYASCYRLPYIKYIKDIGRREFLGNMAEYLRENYDNLNNHI